MSGTYAIFVLPMIDIGLVQNPMFTRESMVWWVQALPGFAPMGMLVDVSFTPGFETAGDLAAALVYLLALRAIAAALFWRATGGGPG